MAWNKKVNKRSTKTVKKTKKTYQYEYRVNEQGKFIRLSKKGYQTNEKLTKLQFKNGKLTKEGQALLESIQKIQNQAQRRYLEREFETYRKSSINKKDRLTLERWQSHLYQNKVERMIYNFGTTPEEIAHQLNATSAETNYTGQEVLQLNWDFDSNTISDSKHSWSMDFDYEAYNGFKITYEGTLNDN